MAYEDFDEKAVPRRQWLHSPWLALLALGWLIYEVTAQPALGVVVCCLKFGWEEVKTALWLRRADAHRARGRACCCLYIAFGLWRVALIACGMMLIMIPLFEMLRNAGGAQGRQLIQDLADQATGIGLLMGLSFVLASATTLLAAALAQWSGCKLWVDGQVHLDRRENCWPPSDDACFKRNNKAGPLVLSSLMVLGLPLMVFAIVCLALANPAGAGAGNPRAFLSGGVAGVFFILVLVGFPIAFLGIRDYLSRRVFARCPSECWTIAIPDAESWHTKEYGETG